MTFEKLTLFLFSKKVDNFKTAATFSQKILDFYQKIGILHIKHTYETEMQFFGDNFCWRSEQSP